MCKKIKSLRDGSFFQKSHLEMSKLLLFMLSWAKDRPLHDSMDDAGFSSRTGVDWANFCRDICGQWFDRDNTELGGFDQNGDPVIVEIDESNFLT